MMKSLVAALAMGAGVIAVGSASAGPGPKATYDGTWNVQIMTEAGPCDRAYTYAVAIDGGRVTRAAGDSDTVITGQIGKDGSIGLGLQSGAASADASGRLQARTGSGTWRLPILGCSGRWTAQRRTVQARAS